MFYFPFAFSVLIIYFASESRSESRLPAIMFFLPICFFWVGDYLRQNRNETLKLREEIAELKQKIEEFKIDL